MPPTRNAHIPDTAVYPWLKAAQARNQPPPPRAQHLWNHILQIADDNNIIVLYQGKGMAYTRRRIITIPPITGQVSYFTALHELGHILGEQPTRRLDQEVAAWRWAFDNSIIDPTPATRRSIQRRLRSYLARAQRRKRMVVPDGFVEYLESIG